LHRVGRHLVVSDPIYTLLAHPNPNLRQYRDPRRETPSGVIVIHTAENMPDLAPPDDGAENVAAWISRRTDPGSYHRLCDSDSIVALVPWWFEAWHDATGTNPHSVGISAATRADQWPSKQQAWRDRCIGRMAFAAADYAHWLQTTHGIDIPARRVTADEARARVPGFTSHGELDPGRRTDPGAAFPWDQFLATYAWLRSPTQEEDMPLTDDDIRRIWEYPIGTRKDPGAPAKSILSWTKDEIDQPELLVARIANAVKAVIPTSAGVPEAAIVSAVKRALREGVAA
jgi:hypothetical protein